MFLTQLKAFYFKASSESQRIKAEPLCYFYDTLSLVS